jgi:2-hydroxy-3-oxopropionate reductase
VKRRVVGFIGLGAMGKEMAANLMKAGFETVVFDIKKERISELYRAGAKVRATAKDLAAICDPVISMVRDDRQTEEVFYGKQGVLEGMQKGTIITMSTISPDLVQMLSLKVKDRINVLDAPVSGGVMGAKAGSLTIMVGGQRDVLDQYHVVLEAMGKRIIFCGGIGAGLVAKLTNSIVVEITIAGVLESLALASKEGVDPSILFSVYKTSTAGSWLIENWDWVAELRKSFKPGGTLELLRKDVGLALDFAKEKGVPLPLTEFSHAIDLADRDEAGDI